MNLQKESKSNFVQHVPCEVCGSRDNAAIYDDGHTFCFGCAAYADEGDTEARVVPQQDKSSRPLLQGEYSALPARKITEETCRKFGYQIGMMRGQPVQIAVYRDAEGNSVAQKVRGKDKQFTITGDASKMTLFGSHLWSSGKKIVVTEGEIDCLTVSQVQNNKWPTVSLPNGAQAAKKAVKQNYDYLVAFEEVVLMFDQDDVGRAAAIECAEILPPGKAKIAYLPFKDPNECLLQGQGSAIIDAIWQAKEYRPDGIISSSELRDKIADRDEVSDLSYPYARLNEITLGMQPASLVTIAAGSGVGKSTLVREMAYHLHQKGHNVGMMMLEETSKRTMQGLVGLHMNKNIVIDPTVASKEDIEFAFDDLTSDRDVYLYDHFGSTDLDTVKNRIMYMAKALDCKVIFLDHVSILVSGLTGQVHDERRLIDQIMTELRVLVQHTGICLVLVSHLKRPNSEAGHEGGAKVHLSQMRGSHALVQLSDCCIGLEVDAEQPLSGIRNLVVLKNRFTGEVGPAGVLQYTRETGRLMDASSVLSF